MTPATSGVQFVASIGSGVPLVLMLSEQERFKCQPPLAEE